MIRKQLQYFLLGLVLTTENSFASYSDCTKCEPHQKCWPSPKQWNELNSTVSGRLSVLRPAATPCHNPNYSNETCSAVWSKAVSQDWRVATPEIMLWPQFESFPPNRESCFIGTSKEDQCKQGSVPLYSIKALETSDIAAGVNFARKHNIRIAIRNSGHDFLGRSAGRNSLQIWTGNIKGIEFSDNWKAKECRASRTDKKEQTVTIGAGIQLHELYSALAQNGRAAVIGFAKTVGAAGGYIHGGGHSPLGPLYGQSSDNALEFELVTAEGEVVRANACHNADLFWALRGGGGGTFGITTRVTLRTFPDPSLVVVQANFSMPKVDGIWPIVDYYHSLAPKMSDSATYSLYWALPNLPNFNNTSAFSIVSFTPNQKDTKQVDEFYKPLLGYARSIGGWVSYTSTRAPSAIKLLTELVNDDSRIDPTISVSLLSRLISAKYLSNPTTRPNVIKALRDIPIPPGTQYLGHVVAGGAVAHNSHLDTALNPAWRKAALHVIAPLGWADNDAMTWDEREKITEQREVEVRKLRKLEPEMGAYGNEADYLEEGWQASFWGANYGRLLREKKKWDPERVFICNRCVGSEGCTFY